MGYFDGLTDACFKKSDTGTTLFFPWGVIGKGYALKSQSEVDRFRGFIKKYYMVILPTVIGIQITVGFVPNLVLLPVTLCWFHFTIKRMLAGMPVTNEKLTLSEAHAGSAKSHNLATLILLEICSLGFVAAGFWIFSRRGMDLAAFASVGFFGLGSISIGFMIFKKLK